MTELHNLPPEFTEPPVDAIGLVAFQPSTGKSWQKVDGKWLPTEAANALIEARKKSS